MVKDKPESFQLNPVNITDWSEVHTKFFFFGISISLTESGWKERTSRYRSDGPNGIRTPEDYSTCNWLTAVVTVGIKRNLASTFVSVSVPSILEHARPHFSISKLDRRSRFLLSIIFTGNFYWIKSCVLEFHLTFE